MSAKHTPGSWRFDQDWGRIPSIFGADGVHVADIYKTTSRGERPTVAMVANASLIAAAPDLLASLKDLLAEIDSFEEIPANLSGATLTTARQRVARAEKQS